MDVPDPVDAPVADAPGEGDRRAARFRATFENAGVGMTEIAGDGRLLAFNKALPRLLGWPADELLTRTAWDVTHPDDLASERAKFDALQAGTCDSYSLEKRAVRKDGTTVWVRLTRSCVRKSDGSVDSFVGVVEDISARKRAEDELRQSEARFKATFENAAVGITHTTPDGHFLRFNDAFARLLGWSTDELIATSAWELTHPDDLALELPQLKRLEEGGIDSYSLDKRMRRKNGTTVWLRLTHSCARKADGSVDYLVGVIEDVSARKFAEGVLADSEARFRATFDNAAVGIAHVTPDGRFLRFNKAFAWILGWPAAELITRSLWEVTHPDDRASERAQLEQLRDGRIDSYNLEKRVMRKDGTTVWLRLTRSCCVYTRDGSVDYLVTVVEDVTARKRAEDELRKSEERFRSTVLHSPVPTILFDDREQIIAVSQSWLTAAGLSQAELHTMGDWTRRAFGPRSDEVLKLIRRIIATEPPQARPDELTILTQSGDKRLWNFVTAALGTQSDGRHLFVSVAEDVTDRRAYEERIHLLMRESRHRTKNILGVVQAIARQTAAGETGHFLSRFIARIQALAANQDLLVRHEWHRIAVKDLVHSQLEPFADLIGTRINFDGPQLHLNATATQAIGLALHELATNASKYGALSTDAGCVDVTWRIDHDTIDHYTFVISWIERNGPIVKPPTRRGFGTTVTEAMVEQTVGGDVQLDYPPAGVRWCLRCDAANALEGGMAKPASSSPDAPPPASKFPPPPSARFPPPPPKPRT